MGDPLRFRKVLSALEPLRTYTFIGRRCALFSFVVIFTSFTLCCLLSAMIAASPKYSRMHSASDTTDCEVLNVQPILQHPTPTLGTALDYRCGGRRGFG